MINQLASQYVANALKSFAVFGFDVKITPQGRVQVIEINGIQAGMQGFALTGNELSQARFNRKLRAAFTDMDEETRETHRGIERILGDKLHVDRLFEDCRDMKPQSYEYTNEGLELLLKGSLGPNIIKPRHGIQGNGVDILDLSNRPEYSSNNIIESFAPSKPIRSSKTGKNHDGCMRYMVLVEEREGLIEVHHFGGYWRLCPKPISDKIDIDAMRANLSLGAIPEAASDEDLRAVKMAVDQIVPIIYQKMLQRANPTKRKAWLRSLYKTLDPDSS
ncbi:hypothetical protein ACFL0V_05715, partial [Nanoarchaeota archaeon]